MSDNPLELAILLKSQDVTMRRQAARSLHALGPEASNAAAELHEAVADPDEEVRMWSALALVNSQEYDKRAVPILVHVLKNENSVLRQVACLSLGLVPYEDKDKEIVVPALAEIAGRDTDEDVRKAAKSALNIIAPDVYGKDKDVVH
jgi:HEAT repeat protein